MRLNRAAVEKEELRSSAKKTNPEEEPNVESQTNARAKKAEKTREKRSKKQPLDEEKGE